MTQLRNVHLTEAEFESWERGILTPAQMEQFLAHTASCPYCGDLWFARMSRESETLENPPVYLKEEILQRVQQPDVVVWKKAHTASKKMQLLMYSLKVGVALAASIYAVFAMDVEYLQMMLNLFSQ